MTDINVANNFPHAVLTPLPTNERPNRQILKLLHIEVNSNAASVYSARGNGALGHLPIVMPEVAYLRASNNVAFVVPANPGVAPVHAAGETAFVIAEVNRQYTNNMTDFRTYNNTEAAIKKQILTAVPLTFINQIRDEMLGFANVKVLTILQHLDDTYGTLTTDDLDNNMALLHKEWSPAQPLEDLFEQIRLCRVFAHDTDPISEKTAVRAAIQNLEKTGLFLETLRDWRRRTPAQQSLANLRLDFTEADRERQRTTTAVSAGYHSASLAASQQLPAPHTAAAATNTQQQTTPTYHYCWSHGYGPNANHRSDNCTFPQPGHRSEATFFNMLGGCNIIHRKRNEAIVYKKTIPSTKPNTVPPS